ncbi:MAG: YitT family protein [Ruminococcaceae bacterium]|nr:YitT family protein [Oscillospiraceae bacterium]
MSNFRKSVFYDYLCVSVGALLVAAGVYFFKFPNNFTFGGVSGFCVVLSRLLPATPGKLNLILNGLFLLLGLITMGRRFALKTAWATVIVAVVTERLEVWCPLEGPLTNEPLLELIFAILLPAVGAALLFSRDASGGGTDILAAIMKDRRGIEMGKGLFISDVLITASSALVFDIQTVLFSALGLLAKSIVVDEFIQNMNLCKCMIIVCDDAEPICGYIIGTLKRSATICPGRGAYAGGEKQVIFTALRPAQAHRLRVYIHNEQPKAFMMVASSSEIMGKGFLPL